MNIGPLKAVNDNYVTRPVFSRVKLIDGTIVWKARSQLPNYINDNLFLYDGIGGSGFHKSKILASRKAISEVIERRAYIEVNSRQQPEDVFGFLQFPGTTGMAAYPSVLTKKAREIALLEAEERWSLLHWWNGSLPTKFGSHKGICFISIKSQFDSYTVVTWHDRGSKRAYGFAAGKTLHKAIKKSIVELSVNRRILDKWDNKDLPSRATWIEKRLIFFSQDEGRRLFEKKVDESLSRNKINVSTKLVVDTEIRGPWSKYSKVWRCLYQGMNKWVCKNPINIFYF